MAAIFFDNGSHIIGNIPTFSASSGSYIAYRSHGNPTEQKGIMCHLSCHENTGQIINRKGISHHVT
jgi:hypothetical protein